MSRKSKGFLAGSLMITLANLVGRAAGAIYRPLLVRLFAPYDGVAGAYGSGLMQIPFSYYQFMLAFTNAGMIALASLIAERIAADDEHGIRRAVKVSAAVMLGFGLLSSVIFVTGSKALATFSGSPASTWGFVATAPALLFVSAAAVFRGYLQGRQSMAPVAVSQILESVVRLAAGVGLVWLSVPFGIAAGAAGANLADAVAVAFALGYVALVFWHSRTQQSGLEPDGGRQTKSQWAFAFRFLAVALPMALVGTFWPGIQLIDSTFAVRNVIAGGLTAVAATGEFGKLAQAYNLVGIPPVIGIGLYFGLVPLLAHAVATGSFEAARDKVIVSYRLAILLAMPASVGLLMLAAPISQLVYGSPDGGRLLSALSLSALAITAHQVATGVLHGMGDRKTPVYSLLAGLAVKLILTLWLTQIFGMTGAAYATVVAYFAAAAWTVKVGNTRLALQPALGHLVVKPAVASAIMAAALAMLYPVALRLTRQVGLSSIVTIGAGVIVFFIALWLIGGISKGELQRLLIKRLRHAPG